MQWIVKVPSNKFRVTVEFNQMRPLSRDLKDRTHNHGAWDVAVLEGANDKTANDLVGGGHGIYAPEGGELAYWFLYRPTRSVGMNDAKYPKTFFNIKDHHYFYDIYGGLIILKGKESGYTHVMTHSYVDETVRKVIPYLDGSKDPFGRDRQSINLKAYENEHRGENGDRFPVVCWTSMENPVNVKAHEIIGLIGNAGFSTGPHIHYEIHKGAEWQKHANRVDPKDVFPEIWENHKNDHRRFYNYEEHREIWTSQ